MLQTGFEKILNFSDKSYIKLRPNFLIPGSGRAGSTFLHSCLKQHPEIYFSTIKEPSYFSRYYDLGEEWYLKHFVSKKIYPIVGEASTQYFYNVKATKRIYDFNPEFKLLFIVRNPVLRAYSNYTREIQLWGETRSFEEIIQKDDRYTQPAMYYTHLSRYLNYFQRDQLFIIIFEKFIKNINQYLKKICEFLEINSNFKFDPNKFSRNPSKVPLNPYFQKFNKNLFRFDRRDPFIIQAIRVGGREVINSINHIFYKSRQFPDMSNSSKKYLKNLFYNEIEKLEELLEEDLSIWKNV